MKQKVITLLACFVVLISNFYNGNLLEVNADTGLISKSTFMDMVKENEYFIKYQDQFLSAIDEPYIFNPTYNEKDIQTGWILQYEFRYNEKSLDKDNLIVSNFNSIISFVYTEDMDTLETTIIDYSNILEKEVIVLNNLNTSETQTFSIKDVGNEELVNFVEDVKIKVEKEEAKIENLDEVEINSIYGGVICYQCTEYMSTGGYHDKKCGDVVGTACRLGRYHWAGKLLCTGSMYIGCYVPKDRLCISGEWVTTCPVAI